MSSSVHGVEQDTPAALYKPGRWKLLPRRRSIRAFTTDRAAGRHRHLAYWPHSFYGLATAKEKARRTSCRNGLRQLVSRYSCTAATIAIDCLRESVMMAPRTRLDWHHTFNAHQAVHATNMSACPMLASTFNINGMELAGSSATATTAA